MPSRVDAKGASYRSPDALSSATQARTIQSQLGKEDNRLAELLFDQLGPKAACVVFHCMDDAAGQVVPRKAAKRFGDNSCSSPTPSSPPALSPAGQRIRLGASCHCLNLPRG